MLGRLTQPSQWDWAIPFPNSIHLAWIALREVFIARPFEATALIAIPIVTMLVSLTWVVGLVFRRFL